MPWVRLEDDFYDHPKFDAVGPFGLGLWIMGLAWCNRNLTNGHISTNQARILISSLDKFGDVNGANVVGELVIAGLWDETGEGGYRYHDYHDYQPTSAEIQQQRVSKHDQKVLAGKQRAAGAVRDQQGRLVSPSQTQQIQQVTSEGTSDVASSSPAIDQPQPQPQPLITNAASPSAPVEPGGSRRKKPETFISDDFGITHAMSAWITGHDYDYLDLAAETAKFVNHAQQNERKCRDWAAAWRNWIIGAAERKPNLTVVAPYHEMTGTEMTRQSREQQAAREVFFARLEAASPEEAKRMIEESAGA